MGAGAVDKAEPGSFLASSPPAGPSPECSPRSLRKRGGEGREKERGRGEEKCRRLSIVRGPCLRTSRSPLGSLAISKASNEGSAEERIRVEVPQGEKAAFKTRLLASRETSDKILHSLEVIQVPLKRYLGGLYRFQYDTCSDYVTGYKGKLQ